MQCALGTTHSERFKKLLAEHVERKLRFDAVFVIDHDQGMVIDIRWLTFVFKIGEVHCASARGKDTCRRRPGDAIHEVKVVTAFFNEGTTRVLGEFIPLSNLRKEGGSVLTKTDHLH